MRPWQPITGIIITTVIMLLNKHDIFGTRYMYLIDDLGALAYVVFFLLLIYIIIRNIIRAIKGKNNKP